MTQEILTILCSGSSLGAYVPGLLLGHQLATKGFATDVVLLENCLLTEKRNNIPKTKFAFHRHFSLARIAQKITGDIVLSLDQAKVTQLLANWQRERRTRFIVIYGFWMPIVEQYLQRVDFDLSVDLCHMDAVPSVSWKHYDVTHPSFRAIWFFNGTDKTLPYRLSVTEVEPLPYNKRNGRFLIHGGGWGLGTYQDKIPELALQGIPLDITVYEQPDLANRLAGNRYFMIDPNWKAWEHDTNGKHHFPPFGEVATDGSVAFNHNDTYPEVHPLIRDCQAIISKPGGSTLVDSLSAATPLILLEPYGEYERKNGELWEALGFGISYDKWAASGYATAILNRLHLNLLEARTRTPNYVEVYSHAAKH